MQDAQKMRKKGKLPHRTPFLVHNVALNAALFERSDFAGFVLTTDDSQFGETVFMGSEQVQLAFLLLPRPTAAHKGSLYSSHH